jgi:outer membrane immunogenic protein
MIKAVIRVALVVLVMIVASYRPAAAQVLYSSEQYPSAQGQFLVPPPGAAPSRTMPTYRQPAPYQPQPVYSSPAPVAPPMAAAPLQPAPPVAPTRPAPYADNAAAKNWQGAYLGLTVGFGGGESHRNFNYAGGGTTGDFNTNGVIGGGAAGYNWQSNSLVLGVEGDMSGTGIGGQTQCPSTSYTCYSENTWLATLRPRIGVALANFMPYVTGGLALGDIHAYSHNPATTTHSDFTDTQLGWTAGAGAEFPVYGNWSFKAEYLYVQFDDAHGPSSSGLPSTVSFDENIVRAGMNYRF